MVEGRIAKQEVISNISKLTKFPISSGITWQIHSLIRNSFNKGISVISREKESNGTLNSKTCKWMRLLEISSGKWVNRYPFIESFFNERGIYSKPVNEWKGWPYLRLNRFEKLRRFLWSGFAKVKVAKLSKSCISPGIFVHVFLSR